MLLLQLLGPGSIRIVLRYTLMFLLLLLLKFLMFLILLLGQLGLLLLVFLIACSISRAGNCGWLVWLQISGMTCIRRLRNIVLRAASVFRTSCIFRTGGAPPADQLAHYEPLASRRVRLVDGTALRLL